MTKALTRELQSALLSVSSELSLLSDTLANAARYEDSEELLAELDDAADSINSIEARAMMTADKIRYYYDYAL